MTIYYRSNNISRRRTVARLLTTYICPQTSGAGRFASETCVSLAAARTTLTTKTLRRRHADYCRTVRVRIGPTRCDGVAYTTILHYNIITHRRCLCRQLIRLKFNFGTRDFVIYRGGHVVPSTTDSENTKRNLKFVYT